MYAHTYMLLSHACMNAFRCCPKEPGPPEGKKKKAIVLCAAKRPFFRGCLVLFFFFFFAHLAWAAFFFFFPSRFFYLFFSYFFCFALRRVAPPPPPPPLPHASEGSLSSATLYETCLFARASHPEISPRDPIYHLSDIYILYIGIYVY